MNMRIGGLVSGMDIDQIVKDLMKAERIPLDKMKQKKQILEWQRDAYRDMNALLMTLREETLKMRLSQTYRARNVSSTNESLVSAIASPGASSVSYTIQKVTQLASAATKINAGALSKSISEKIDPSKSLWAQKDLFANNTFNWKSGGIKKDLISVTEAKTEIELSTLSTNIKVDQDSVDNMEIFVNGKAYKVVTNPAELNDQTVLLDTSEEKAKLIFSQPIQANSSVQANYFVHTLSQDITVPKDGADTFTLPARYIDLKMTMISVYNEDGTLAKEYTVVTSKDQLTDDTVWFDSETGKLTFNTKLEEGQKFSVTYQQNYFTFGIQTYNENGEPVKDIIAIDGSASLNAVLNEINRSNVGVTAFYDSFTDRITLTRAKTGDFNKAGEEIVTFGDFINKVLQFEGVSETGGVNAKFMINGLETERFSNTFTIGGVNFTLKGTFDSTDGSGTSPVTVNITTNVDAVYENIKAFVDKYNEIIGKINEKLLEKKYRDYLPLTDEQRKELDEKQIELWEEKAKSGLIRGDTILSNALNKFRLDLYSVVENEEIPDGFKHLSAIGITTSTNYMDRGKLVINETKLKEAIEKNPDAVYSLFAATGSNEAQQGIAQRLADSITKAMDQINERAGKSYWAEQQYSIGKNLLDINRRIESFEKRLLEIENRYWRQFTAMEKAVQRANQQSMFFMQQFGGTY